MNSPDDSGNSKTFTSSSSHICTWWKGRGSQCKKGKVRLYLTQVSPVQGVRDTGGGGKKFNIGPQRPVIPPLPNCPVYPSSVSILEAGLSTEPCNRNDDCMEQNPLKA